MVGPHELLLLLLLFCLLIIISPCVAELCSWDNFTVTETTVKMTNCGLEEFPPAPSRLTAVTKLYLKGNPLTRFPNITALAGSLEVLTLQGTFISIDDDLITPLANLQHIDIRNGELVAFPNLTMAARSLTVLTFVSARITVIPPEMATSFTNLTVVILDFCQLNHFPDLRNSGATLTKIAYRWSKIAIIPANITRHFTALETILMDKNKLTEFPVLTASGSTLRTIDLASNRITNIPAKLTKPLAALGSVNLAGNRLSKFPDLTNSSATLRTINLASNRITNIPAKLTKPLAALGSVTLAANRLSKFPDLTNSSATLRELKISDNQISALPSHLLRPLVNLVILDVNNNPVKTLPHLPGLTKLTFVGVANTHIIQLPPLWSQNPSSMALTLEDSTLDLCSCRNLWIKEAQATYNSLTFTDQMCCSGQSWSSYSIDGLRADCTDDIQQKRVTSTLTDKASLYPQPGPTILLHSYLPGSDRPTCTITCLQTDSCVGFWLGPDGCVISAPTADPVTVPGVGDPVWTFYGINMI